MEKNPDVFIAVTGGGSGTGIAGLINKNLDIANSSRKLRPEEVEQARKRGVEPVEWVIAMDGLSVILHEKNPVESLTLKELGRIFRGELTNWNQVGGVDMPISLYGRQSNSGTFIFFRDKVLKGDYSPRMMRMNGNAQIVEAVKRDVAGIGYVGIGYIKDKEGKVISGIRVLKVKESPDSTPISPLEPENVKKGLYPLVRPLYQYTDGIPDRVVLDFIKFELSKEGEKIMVEEGFYPPAPEYRKLNQERLKLKK
jgi:phosphate transport system substrate-binding protein